MIRPVCIILARPFNDDDPCLIQAQGRNALVQTLDALSQIGVISQSILSIPNVVPSQIVSDLKSEGFNLCISKYDQPQHRLVELMDWMKVDTVVVLTAYSLLPEYRALKHAIRTVTEGHADLVFTQDVIPPKFFMVINRRVSQALVENMERPVPPFVFPAKLGEADHEGRFTLQPLTGLEESGERFLWELLFAGKPNAVPVNVFERFLAVCPPEHRFDRAAYRSFIQDEYTIEDMAPLETGLAMMSRWEPSIRLAMHINHARYLAPHFPDKKKTALEIGYGWTGITAQLVGLAFSQTRGVDLLKHSQEGVQTARDFLSMLAEIGLSPVPVFEGDAQPPQFFHCRLEEAKFESDSIDFCFSRMVLEHIDNMPVLARELGRIIRPGGVMVHEIGTQDHEDLSHIHFEFLRHSPQEWAALDKGTNLLRPCDFITFFEQVGFECLVLERDVRIVRPRRLHPYWEGYADEDLFCPRVVIKCVRRA
ncbi:MAG: class I SAM-dependent methyltransferase [Desulfobacterales bacterium]|nr:class I SAM-dependent methyltransferase [Desulfobacterales bacterium]